MSQSQPQPHQTIQHEHETELVDLFAPYGLVLECGDLMLRPLRETDMPALTRLYQRPIFADPDADHVFGWAKVSEPQRSRNAFAFYASNRGSFGPDDWRLQFGVWAAGDLIGTQDLTAKAFQRAREVHSGSWLALDQHGRGYGRLMRQMVLVFAFDHLGAQTARSEALPSNGPSLGVSRSCGYQLDGTQILLDPADGRALSVQRVLCTPKSLRRPDVPVRVSRLTDDLRELLGATEER